MSVSSIIAGSVAVLADTIIKTMTAGVSGEESGYRTSGGSFGSLDNDVLKEHTIINFRYDNEGPDLLLEFGTAGVAQDYFKSLNISGPNWSETLTTASADGFDDIGTTDWRWDGSRTAFTNGGTYILTFTF